MAHMRNHVNLLVQYGQLLSSVTLFEMQFVRYVRSKFSDHIFTDDYLYQMH